MFICLFVCLIVYRFVLYLNDLGTPTEIYPENFVKIRHDWLRYLGSKKMFICLFVCLFVDLFVFYFNHLWTPTGMYPDNFVKI